jgi:predicted nucleic acid-binding protein
VHQAIRGLIRNGITLAEALEIPLITTDRRLARSRGHHAEIELY